MIVLHDTFFFDNVDIQGLDLIMEYGAGLRSVSELARDAQGLHDYLLLSSL